MEDYVEKRLKVENQLERCTDREVEMKKIILEVACNSNNSLNSLLQINSKPL